MREWSGFAYCAIINLEFGTNGFVNKSVLLIFNGLLRRLKGIPVNCTLIYECNSYLANLYTVRLSVHLHRHQSSCIYSLENLLSCDVPLI